MFVLDVHKLESIKFLILKFEQISKSEGHLMDMDTFRHMILLGNHHTKEKVVLLVLSFPESFRQTFNFLFLLFFNS